MNEPREPIANAAARPAHDRAGRFEGLRSALLQRRSTKQPGTGAFQAPRLEQLLRTSLAEDAEGRRPYGSAHSRYPVRVFAIIGSLTGIDDGVYEYDAATLRLLPLVPGDHRAPLAYATLDGAWARACPVVLVLAADLDGADQAFAHQGPHRGTRYCWIEAGLIAQTLQLCAAALGLSTVFLGGLDDPAMERAAAPLLPRRQSVLGVMPVDAAPPAPGTSQNVSG